MEDFTARTIAVADSDGLRASSSSQRTRQRLEATVSDHGARSRGLSRYVLHETSQRPYPGAGAVARQALDNALHASRAAVTGQFCTPVVFGPSAAAGFLHELIGHALEGDNFALDSVYLAALRRGPAITDKLTIIDDPSLADGHGSRPIDDEGMQTRPTTLLAQGKIVSPLTSVRTSRRNGYTPSGSGRRMDYRHLALPRASNTVVLPGTEEPTEMHRDTRAGVLIVDCLGAGMINLATGEFSFAGLNCTYVTPGGERIPARDVSLVGDALDALSRIDAIGSDMGGDSSTCGKQGQLVGIGVFSPSMRFTGLKWTAS
nr:TldD/PmbA family protein [Streptomyces sp. SID14478]